MKSKIQSKTGHKIINLNRRKAIREKCLNCSGWAYKEVEICPFTNCQLYPFRSKTSKQNPKARNKAIRQYCLWCCTNNQTDVSKCPARYCPLWAYRRGKLEINYEMLFLSEKRPHRGCFQPDQTEGHIRV